MAGNLASTTELGTTAPNLPALLPNSLSPTPLVAPCAPLPTAALCLEHACAASTLRWVGCVLLAVSIHMSVEASYWCWLVSNSAYQLAELPSMCCIYTKSHLPPSTLLAGRVGFPTACCVFVHPAPPPTGRPRDCAGPLHLSAGPRWLPPEADP